MELPLRARGDELLPDGALVALRGRLRRLAARGPDLTTVIAYAFDGRTRMLPFRSIDKFMVPAGVRELASNLLDAGFSRTRIVLGQWSPCFRPSEMRLDGEIPDLFLVSSLSVHSAHLDRMLADVRAVPADRRPLVLAGGAHVIYEPWWVFSNRPDVPWGADAACTGEAYVFLELLEALLESRGAGETLRQTFHRLRDEGALDSIPGLVYARGERDGVAEELVDTGIQRLLRSFDEVPSPVLGYQVLEPPSRWRRGLASKRVPAWRIRWIAFVASIQITQGCKFRCPYCPIPAYNQQQDRTRSPERLVEDFRALYETYRIPYAFGTDDNFFNRKDQALAYFEALARATTAKGKPLGRKFLWGTEATVHDTYAARDHLVLAREAGLAALWMGIEDMTATLVKKGQSVNKTREVFRALRKASIQPMPMMIHDDTQPLVTFRSSRGLLNQTQLVRHWGALTFQVTSLQPAAGTKLYKETYQSGMAFDRVRGKPVEPYLVDGNHVVASHAKRPWRVQLGVLLAFSWFYNPLRFALGFVLPKCKWGHLKDPIYQGMGMYALFWTWLKVGPWLYRLWRGPIERTDQEPRSSIPMRSVDGGEAPHDLPPGPDPKRTRRLPARSGT